MMLVALAGQKRSGKDTAARALVERGFAAHAFADKVRDAVVLLDPVLRHQDGGPPVLLSSLLSSGHDFESLKDSAYRDDLRRMLQRTGTDLGQVMFGSDIWTSLLGRTLERCGAEKVVITDCRFPHEADWVRARGGVVVRIRRPATDVAVPEHASEAIDLVADVEVVNDSSVDDLHRSILGVLGLSQ